MTTVDLTSTTAPLGDWVDELFNKIFFQPDDALAISTFETYLGSDLVVRINHEQHTGAAYLQGLKAARAKNSMTSQSNDEITVWNAPDGSGGGCVAHMGRFTLRDKETGVETKSSSLTLVNVKVRDGVRVMVELTEVMN